MQEKAFTLLEICIVFVIVGLLASGVMVGRDMIRAAEIRSLITQIEQVQTASNTFRLKYNAMAGDMRDATRYWTAAGGTGADSTCYETDSTTLATPEATCNGNGNGRIDNVSTVLTDNWVYAERFRFWHHLANADLIEGRFTGRTGPASNWNRLPGTNLPETAMSGNGISIVCKMEGMDATQNYSTFDDMRFHVLSLSNDGVYPFTPQEMLQIDTKLDDGMPGLGRIYSYKTSSTWAPDCADSDDPTMARYNTAYEAPACWLLSRIK